jgi:succinate dehydrogenase hydrophobic anchor subunit
MIINEIDTTTVFIKYPLNKILRQEVISLIASGTLIGGMCLLINAYDKNGIFNWTVFTAFLLIIFTTFKTHRWYGLWKNWQNTITIKKDGFTLNQKNYKDSGIKFIYASNIGKSDHGYWLFIQGEKHQVVLFKRLSRKQLDQIGEHLIKFYGLPFNKVDADTVL